MQLESTIEELQSQIDSAPFKYKKSASDLALPEDAAKYLLKGHQGTVRQVAFHPTYSILASASDDCSIKLWDFESGNFLQTLRGHTKVVQDVIFSTDGSLLSKREAYMLVTCSADTTIKIWDTKSEYRNIRTLKGHEHTVSSVSMIPGTQFIVSVSRDATIRVWDSVTGYAYLIEL